MAKTALVLGSTGLVGSHLLDLLLASGDYSKVVTLVRRPGNRSNSKLQEQVCDLDSMADYADLFAVDEVYCCLGTTIKQAGSREAFRKVDYDYCLQAAHLAKEHGVQCFLQITAIGADAASPVFYSRVKGELEQGLRQIGFDWLYLFQPSLLLGARQEFRFAESLGEPFVRVFRLLLGKTENRWLPIEADKVAQAMFSAANSQDAKGCYRWRYQQMINRRSDT